jgi:hypothetical protein
MTDNDASYKSLAIRRPASASASSHRINPSHPPTIGKAERFIQTSLGERSSLARASNIPQNGRRSSSAMALGLMAISVHSDLAARNDCRVPAYRDVAIAGPCAIAELKRRSQHKHFRQLGRP